MQISGDNCYYMCMQYFKLYGLAINHLIGPLSTWKQVLIKFLQSVLLITDKRAKRAINVVDCIAQ